MAVYSLLYLIIILIINIGFITDRKPVDINPVISD